MAPEFFDLFKDLGAYARLGLKKAVVPASTWARIILPIDTKTQAATWLTPFIPSG